MANMIKNCDNNISSLKNKAEKIKFEIKLEQKKSATASEEHERLNAEY
jgi:hypothetical protein